MPMVTRNGKHRNSERGFTLLELLLALALLSLILSSLFSWFDVSKRAWERSSVVEDADQLMAVRTFLREKIEGALPVLRPGSAANKPTLVFSGTPTSIVFVGTSQGYTEVGGIYEYNFHGWPQGTFDGSAREFIAHQRMSALPSTEVGLVGPTRSRELVNNLQTIRFSYFGAQTQQQTPAWQATWSSANRLPQLVKLDIEFAQTGERHWPSLVIALKLAQGTTRLD